MVQAIGQESVDSYSNPFFSAPQVGVRDLQIHPSSILKRASGQNREDFLRQTSNVQAAISKCGLVRSAY